MIVNLLRNRSRCYARQCIVKEIDRNTAAKFINEYHLLGYTNDKIRIGLYYKDELVSVMTFGRPRYNRKYEYELVRYCSGWNVVGGAEKLFDYFLKQYDPQSIVSYCDKSKFRGDIYTSLGFSEVGTSNEELMRAHEVVEIYDAGQTTYSLIRR